MWASLEGGICCGEESRCVELGVKENLEEKKEHEFITHESKRESEMVFPE